MKLSKISQRQLAYCRSYPHCWELSDKNDDTTAVHKRYGKLPGKMKWWLHSEKLKCGNQQCNSIPISTDTNTYTYDTEIFSAWPKVMGSQFSLSDKIKTETSWNRNQCNDCTVQVYFSESLEQQQQTKTNWQQSHARGIQHVWMHNYLCSLHSTMHTAQLWIQISQIMILLARNAFVERIVTLLPWCSSICLSVRPSICVWDGHALWPYSAF